MNLNGFFYFLDYLKLSFYFCYIVKIIKNKCINDSYKMHNCFDRSMFYFMSMINYNDTKFVCFVIGLIFF